MDRVIVNDEVWECDRKKGRTHHVLVGSTNHNTVIYTGTIANCLHIKKALLETGDYNDESAPQYKVGCQ